MPAVEQHLPNDSLIGTRSLGPTRFDASGRFSSTRLAVRAQVHAQSRPRVAMGGKALTLADAVSKFGKAAKAKLTSPTASGEPEDQLRAPFEQLLADVAAVLKFKASDVVAVGESTIAEIRTRPDYAVTVRNALAGHIELKAPGKGADPRKFKDGHDKAQWGKLQSLPNLIYTDGNEFSLWRSGEIVGKVERLDGDVESSGSNLGPSGNLLGLFEAFLSWEPIPPTSAKDLAHVSAHLCRLLRDEVTDELGRGGKALSGLAADWRKLLFPEATDKEFADGYAQAVTFGLLMARAWGISGLADLHKVAESLKKSNTLIGTALQLLTDNADTRTALATSLGTLERVLEVVDWPKLSKGKTDAWLYFYEEFLEVYDNVLRKKTGSYYTPPEVVSGMVKMVQEALQSPGFGLPQGLASPSVTIADPAVGTGTYVLGLLRHIAHIVESEQGAGAVKAAVEAALGRILGFELQLGPYAVAQLRIVAEVVQLTGGPPKAPLRMFVTDTLSSPHEEEEWLPSFFEPIAKQRKDANKIKREVPITVVVGNPPYKEKAKGRGAWVESGPKDKSAPPLLDAWMPPPEWDIGAHAKHLRNLYVYFWRWASWQVFENHAESDRGIVCFITVAGFLAGPGFQRMREDLRKKCDAIWVIDCSPEGHQPVATTRIFQGVQQPICIVLAARWTSGVKEHPATVLWRALPEGHRQDKFDELAKLSLSDDAWQDCPPAWREPFLPAAAASWASYPSLEDLFAYGGAGVMPGRTWIIAPDPASLASRWTRLVSAPAADKERLFHPHIAKVRKDGKVQDVLGDRYANRVVTTALAGYAVTERKVADETGASVAPVRYGFRSFDRQWIIPDVRLINRPNPKLWAVRSDKQVYLTAPHDRSPSNGPALTVTALVPDLHHYNGRGGRTIPLWADTDQSNLSSAVLIYLSERFGTEVSAEDLFAYIVGIAAHTEYTARFQEDLATPGLRIPLTEDNKLFHEVAQVGRHVVWLHTFGERMASASEGRPASAPRLPDTRRPRVPKDGAIPTDPEHMPDILSYDAGKQRLQVGSGWIEPVPLVVWKYEVSGKQVLPQWFSYRRKNRERPIIGDRRPPSPLSDIQPDAWLAEYTSELLDVLNVLGLLVELEPVQAKLLSSVCDGPLITTDALQQAGVLAKPEAAAAKVASAPTDSPQGDFFIEE